MCTYQGQLITPYARSLHAGTVCIKLLPKKAFKLFLIVPAHLSLSQTLFLSRPVPSQLIFPYAHLRIIQRLSPDGESWSRSTQLTH